MQFADIGCFDWWDESRKQRHPTLGWRRVATIISEHVGNANMHGLRKRLCAHIAARSARRNTYAKSSPWLTATYPGFAPDVGTVVLEYCHTSLMASFIRSNGRFRSLFCAMMWMTNKQRYLFGPARVDRSEPVITIPPSNQSIDFTCNSTG